MSLWLTLATGEALPFWCSGCGSFELVKKGVFVNELAAMPSRVQEVRRAERTDSAQIVIPASEVHLFHDGQGIINLIAEIPDGAFNLGVAEQ